jgi:small nuclear ribonucleoprotein (snRNP)-like protein
MSFRRLRRKRVVLNTKDGQTFRGVLWAKCGALVMLRGAELVAPNGGAVKADGDLFVERSNVSFYQLLPDPVRA